MIRHAKADDIASIAALQGAVENERAIWGYVEESREEWAKRDFSWTYVAVDGARLLGFVHCLPRPYSGECVFPAESKILEIVDLIIAPDARNGGLGRELVAIVRRRARFDGFTHLRVYSASKRFDDIVRFYRSCGFIPWYLEMTQEIGANPDGMEIEVRPAEPGDAAAVQTVDALAIATLRETYRPNRAALENRARLAARMDRLVATCDGHVVGTVQWYVEGDSIGVVALGVHPQFRRRGVARQLLAYLESIAKEHGATQLRLHTVRETGNVEVFLRLGYRTVTECEDEFSESDSYPTLTDVRMAKDVFE